MKKSFIGSGFNFPMKIDSSGNVAMSHDEENIEQSIKIILGTAKGERLYRATFGCAIHDLVFQPNNRVTAARVESAVKESLQQYEFRIKDIEHSPLTHPLFSTNALKRDLVGLDLVLSEFDLGPGGIERRPCSDRTFARFGAGLLNQLNGAYMQVLSLTHA